MGLTKDEYIERGTRPSFHEWFGLLAETVSLRGDCIRSRVGAVVATPHNGVLGVGYNGTPGRKLPGCLEGACPRGKLSYDTCPPEGSYSNCIASHAEENALGWALDNVGRHALIGCSMWVTRKPCDRCKMWAKSFGLITIHWPDGVMVL